MTASEKIIKSKRHNTLSNNLLKILDLTGMKAYEICSICNINDSTYSRFMKGEYLSIDPIKLEPLCAIVHLTIDELRMEKDITSKYLTRKDWRCNNYEELWEKLGK